MLRHYLILQFTSLIILNQSLYLTCTLFILGPTVSVCYNKIELQSFQIKNNRIGFNQLLEELDSLKNHEIVFEATGVYSRRLQSFLDENNETYTKLNPLQAKKELDSLRPNKTDKNDARSLAITQETFNRQPISKEKIVYIKLRDWSRYYAQVNHDLVTNKNRLHRCLQLTFPEIEDFLSNTDGELYWNIVKLFPTSEKSLGIRSKSITMDSEI